MNVLEKILEEIDKKADYYECDEQGREHVRMVDVIDVEEIIRSHMDEVPNCGECSRRKWYQKGYEDGKKDNDWIPVSDKLPEAGDGKYYPLLNVQTSYGAVKCGFYRVRDDRWYIYEEFYNEFVEANKKEVVAWQPFPEPYKEE
ncbi:DUF551 domain-containing protein [Mediterraneibacter gnavus]|uniref:DUF551 domain-containing protein n=1 Tax=Mediterraneibacter gnavus TaxID=33038 RepID=A0A8B3BTL4_MEDGN|nr:DUF551 domain-containing protein [Mediterraneibacter gnavus]RHJ12626.1 DUF551 domain-containing protein [Mediterraneibacter gnavus]